MTKLTEAILAVMEDVKGIEKSMQVGTGKMQYKGVPDKEVKKIIGTSMRENGLIILPIKIEPKTEINRWEVTDNYGVKQKQSVFTEVLVTYKLIHSSGESIELSGYGQGVDSQDKGAGKATTYALKYALLYAFLVPTGAIDDSDTTHSNDINKAVKTVKKSLVVNKAKLDKTRFDNAMGQIKIGKYSGDAMKVTFELTEEQFQLLDELEMKIKEDAKEK